MGEMEGWREVTKLILRGLYLVAHLGMGGEITTLRAVGQPQ